MRSEGFKVERIFTKFIRLVPMVSNEAPVCLLAIQFLGIIA